MFTFIATIFSIKWISEHIIYILLGFAFIIYLILYVIIKNHKIKRAAIAQQQEAARERARQAELQRIEQEKTAAAAKAKEAQNPTVHIPEEVDGKQCKYSYKDVIIIPMGTPSAAHPSDQLNLLNDGEHICVMVKDTLIGYLNENRLAEMVRDWDKSGDPYLCYFAEHTDNGPMIALFFYCDIVKRFQDRHPEAKQFRLAGKPDEFSFYSKGKDCSIEEDYETDKYQVLCDGGMIGFLPAAAVSYAEKHNISPEDLDIIIASVDYDPEKDRDVIYVLVAE